MNLTRRCQGGAGMKPAPEHRQAFKPSRAISITSQALGRCVMLWYLFGGSQCSPGKPAALAQVIGGVKRPTKNVQYGRGVNSGAEHAVMAVPV